MDIVDYRSKGTYPRRDLDFIYIMVAVDHHYDPIVLPYATLDYAKDMAKKFANDFASENYPIKIIKDLPGGEDRRLFLIEYGEDGRDCVFVVGEYINF